MGKDAGFRIRVERDLRDEFVDVCRTHDRPAAQVIRDFMRLRSVRQAASRPASAQPI